MGSWTRLPGSAAAAKPRPKSTPTIAGTDSTAAGEPRPQAQIALHVGADAGRIPEGEDLDHAAERVAGLLRLVDGRHHAATGLRVATAHRTRLHLLDVGDGSCRSPP